MMQNLYNPADKDDLVRRVHLLTADTKPQWGIMTATEMMSHCAEFLRMPLGELPMRDKSNFLMKTLGKYLIITRGWFPKNSPTAPEFDMKNHTISPEDFEEKRALMVNCLNRVALFGADHTFPIHTLFGELSREEWGRSAFVHTNYHLGQFGV